MTDRPPFRALPKARVPDTLDRARLERLLCGLVRLAHPKRPVDPHEGEAEEEVFVRSVVKRGSCFHVRYGYYRNAHPSSRYDKSELADGRLRLDLKGEVIELSLGRLVSALG